VAEINHPTEGPVRIIGNPIHLSRCEARTGVAPLLGQHTDEVLKEAGYSEEEIAAFRKEEVV
jgi:formyl-CoA transferase